MDGVSISRFDSGATALQTRAAELADLGLRGDHSIDYMEFLAACLDQCLLLRDDSLKISFRHFDTDGNGFISRQEFMNSLASVQLSPESIASFLNSFDCHGTMELSYDDFVMMMYDKST